MNLRANAVKIGVTQRNPAKQVPGGAEIQAAKIAANRRDHRAVGEPQFAAANHFGALVGQHEIDGGGDGLAVDAEQFVRGGIGRGRVRHHAESVGNRLKGFLLVAQIVRRTPVPRLVHVGSMGRIEQPEHSLIDVGGKLDADVGGVRAR